MSAYKIIGGDGKEYGPVSIEQLQQWVADGRINGQTVGQAEGTTDWKPLSAFPDTAAIFGPPRVAPPLPPPSISTAKPSGADKKIAAGLCGILLGQLGIHKFILGYTNEGIIMLVVTVCSIPAGFLTCGVGFLAAGAIHIIGIIEGIIYLTKSDEDFVATYVTGRKGWF